MNRLNRALAERSLRAEQRAGRLPSTLGRWPVRVSAPRGMGLADSCLHEAAHAVACVETGAAVLASLADERDGLTLFDHEGLSPDEIGVIAVAGMSACGWRWIGLSDAVLSARCLALSGCGLPSAAAPAPPRALRLLRRWEARARRILAERALLHAQLALLLAARGAIAREDVERLAGPQPRRGAASRLWDSCREDDPGSVREAAASFVFRAAWDMSEQPRDAAPPIR